MNGVDDSLDCLKYTGLSKIQLPELNLVHLRKLPMMHAHRHCGAHAQARSGTVHPRSFRDSTLSQRTSGLLVLHTFP